MEMRTGVMRCDNVKITIFRVLCRVLLITSSVVDLLVRYDLMLFVLIYKQCNYSSGQ